VSFSGPGAAAAGLRVWPVNPTLDAYRKVIDDDRVWLGYRNTFLRVVVGTSATLFMIIITAYPLSKRELPHRKVFSVFVIITMFFRGGMIPEYLLIRTLGLMNTFLSLILPRLIDTFALIVMRNYFMSLPDSMEESARMDGAGYLTILFRIVVPMSVAIVATVTLWTAVWHWNEWFHAMIYIHDEELIVLQIVLRSVILEGTEQIMAADDEQAITNPDVVKAATIMFATFPILCVYPFLQRYFVKGVIVGAVKG
jgi:putative aldouronate transport system permease protein